MIQPVSTPQPTAFVLRAFNAAAGQPERLGAEWDYGTKIERMVLAPVSDPATAGASAVLRETLSIEHVQLARSIRASDGRLIVTKWKASTFIPGVRMRRTDETVAAALRVDTALESVTAPALKRNNNDPFHVAETPAFDPEHSVWDDEILLGSSPLRDLLARLRDAYQPLDLPSQLTHTDMLGTTIYDGDHLPALTDIVPAWRPRGATAAQTIVDAMMRSEVDPGIIDRFRYIDQLDQLLLRCVVWRIIVHTKLEKPHPSSAKALQSVGHHLVSNRSDTL